MQLDREDVLVTADAMHTQRAASRLIISGDQGSARSQSGDPPIRTALRCRSAVPSESIPAPLKFVSQEYRQAVHCDHEAEQNNDRGRGSTYETAFRTVSPNENLGRQSCCAFQRSARGRRDECIHSDQQKRSRLSECLRHANDCPG